VQRTLDSKPYGLAIDVGNTNVVVGAFRANRLEEIWRLHTGQEKTAEEYGVLVEHLLGQAGLGREQIGRAVICSVVPPLTSQFCRLCRLLFDCEALLLQPEKQELIPIEYESRADVGADRIANALALRALYGTPGIVVDFGTATTVDAVSAKGAYLGGAIAPGILTSLDALFSRAAKLPRVELVRPRRAIGRNTVESIQSGTVFGYAGMIEGLVAHCTEELTGKPVVVATGGLAPLICNHLRCIDHVDDHLTLKGLIIFAEAQGSAAALGRASVRAKAAERARHPLRRDKKEVEND
jgi:type III pantothenate kinase